MNIEYRILDDLSVEFIVKNVYDVDLMEDTRIANVAIEKLVDELDTSVFEIHRTGSHMIDRKWNTVHSVDTLSNYVSAYMFKLCGALSYVPKANIISADCEYRLDKLVSKSKQTMVEKYNVGKRWHARVETV